jgi:hypothetical protein
MEKGGYRAESANNLTMCDAADHGSHFSQPHRDSSPRVNLRSREYMREGARHTHAHIRTHGNRRYHPRLSLAICRARAQSATQLGCPNCGLYLHPVLPSCVHSFIGVPGSEIARAHILRLPRADVSCGTPALTARAWRCNQNTCFAQTSRAQPWRCRSEGVTQSFWRRFGPCRCLCLGCALQ